MKKHAGGRPPKFSEASRAVTVTLPDRTLAQLRGIDGDRAKAIVEAVDAVVGDRTPLRHGVEVVEVAPGTGILVIPGIPSLRRIPWIKTIKVAPTRHLLTIVSGTPIEKVELALADLVDQCRQTTPHDVPLLEELRAIFGNLRRGERISKAEILFVATRSQPAKPRG